MNVLLHKQCRWLLTTYTDFVTEIYQHFKRLMLARTVESCWHKYTGWTAILATPQKTESQTWGEEEKTESKNSPHVWDFVFLGGGKKDESPCMG